MAGRVLILRPQPGADATAARARLIGLEPVVAPLFTIAATPWPAPEAGAFDAIMLTSANAARMAGPQLAGVTRLPCYAVGAASAASATAAGFARVVVGPSDAHALVEQIDRDGVRSVLHLCGADRTDLPPHRFSIEHQVVYEAEAVTELPAAARHAIDAGALVLLHSPRAAATFANLCDRRANVSIAVISEAAAKAAGTGWAAVAWPEQPRDQALLELAAKLCNSADPSPVGGQ